MNLTFDSIRRIKSLLKMLFLLTIYFSCLNVKVYGQSATVKDYDGNIYNTVKIGDQLWMKEDLKSLHYSDGSVIPGALAYNNNEALVQTYGRLYTWFTAMKNSTTEAAQGACPNGWHLPTDAEWTTLTNYVGGEDIAGGHLKETGKTHWSSPNTGADNSSGFTALPSGVYFDNLFHYLKYNVEYWTSSNSSINNAFYRILYYDMGYVVRTDYFDKSSSRSVRCLCNEVTEVKKNENEFLSQETFSLFQNYPNPFNPSTTIQYQLASPSYVKIIVANTHGETVATLVDSFQNSGNYETIFNADNFSSGVYYFQIIAGKHRETKKMIVLR